MSIFDGVEQAPPDAIFGVATKFNASPLKEKQLLSVGVYRTEDAKPLVFPSVSKAEDKIIHKFSKDYLPMTGYPPFVKAARELLWTKEKVETEGERIASVQSCAGTGALFLVSRFASRILKVPKVLLSNPMWPNYRQIFGENGNEIATYPWIKEGLLDIDGFLASIKEQPEGCLLVVQACAHNPTGVDPNEEEWVKILDLAKEKKHVICFDYAYMGFGSGDIDIDSKVVRDFLMSGEQFFVCFSFSKCMGLYGERIGCCHAVCANKKEADAVSSQLAMFGRQCWSVCPQNGAPIATEILNDSQLFEEWKDELKVCGTRIIQIRQKLCDLLETKTGKSWEFLRKQKGMFALTGLTPGQVQNLAEEGVFIPASGRVSIPALNNSNVEFVAQAIANVVNK
ncbi:aminotransferase, classes I and II family protein [Tritrichomonas foetus]|uniref:Aspartate aminotransferase n=1 Tax=Tritrichomonas foetus TaxID=1144522 RepID=A0A1J4JBI8_9EUKA|nr:aminotransferase, classes I and II family protein [Tritrichomonas foetus]|eukprot:OHS95019.1 aminotransferase, classes I and II family protein [Tritrichomonas foetus]